MGETLASPTFDAELQDEIEVFLTRTMANPPFGGRDRAEVQQNFPIRTGKTAFLFLQHFIRILRAGDVGASTFENTLTSTISFLVFGRYAGFRADRTSGKSHNPRVYRCCC